jgi:hypothetical protein
LAGGVVSDEGGSHGKVSTPIAPRVETRLLFNERDIKAIAASLKFISPRNGEKS